MHGLYTCLYSPTIVLKLKYGIQMLKEESNWLICADPESRHIYTLNVNTEEVHIERDVDPEYRARAMKAIDDIESLLKLSTGRTNKNKSPLVLHRQLVGGLPAGGQV